MNKYFDITNPDAAYEWLYSVLDLKQGDLVEDYILKCDNDIDKFFKAHIEEIEKIDLNNLEFVAVHVTSNDDNCRSLKKHGLRNLKLVLSENTNLSRFLSAEQIRFDIERKLMFIRGKEYSIDYQKYLDMYDKSKEEDRLERIAHKIYYDFQVNGFFFNRNIFSYGTGIDKHPEFLYTLSEFNKITEGLDGKWDKFNQGYVIKYKSHVRDFEYYSFYESMEEYLEDFHSNWLKLRYWLLSRAVLCCFSDLASEVFAYMKAGIVITPERILECIPVKDWRDNDSKYFG